MSSPFLFPPPHSVFPMLPFCHEVTKMNPAQGFLGNFIFFFLFLFLLPLCNFSQLFQHWKCHCGRLPASHSFTTLSLFKTFSTFKKLECKKKKVGETLIIIPSLSFSGEQERNKTQKFRNILVYVKQRKNFNSKQNGMKIFISS